nr:hypothetical protein [Nocardia farcinica]
MWLFWVWWGFLYFPPGLGGVRVISGGGGAARAALGPCAAWAPPAPYYKIHYWVLATRAGLWTWMAVPSDGSYGVPDGLISSFPVTCADGAYRIVEGLEVDAFSRERIDASVAELAAEREAVVELGFAKG